MTSTAFQTQVDQQFFAKLYESMKRIFSLNRQEWTCQQIFQFLTLIKVESKLENLFYNFSINGELLFDPKYLWTQLVKYLQSNTYFPIMKLMHVVSRINVIERKSSQKIKFVRNTETKKLIENIRKVEEKQGKESQRQLIKKSSSLQSHKQTHQAKTQATFNSQNLLIKKQTNQTGDPEQASQQIYEESSNFISVQGKLLKSLDEEFGKLGQALIADLSCNQLAKIFKASQITEGIRLSELIKKYSIDGFCIVCIFSDRETLLQESKFFFSNQEMQDFQCILNLVLPFYFRQIAELKQRKKQLQPSKNINFEFLQKSEPITSENLSQSKSSFGKSELGTSEIYSEAQGYSESGSVQYGTSQYDTESTNNAAQSLTKSVLAGSQQGHSVYGQSQYVNSQYASSQYATSQRGSVRGSMAESVMGESMIQQNNYKPERRKDGAISSVQDNDIIHRLQEVALTLPFNLFKMDPLQNIKITSLNYPFTLNFQKPKTHDQFVRNLKDTVHKLKSCSLNTVCSQDFNITGVKFGRSQQNDFRYPDELSISAKHAQIGFWDNKYQIVDLQSKTGTFLYIPLTKPLILKDEHIIQLSNQIQFIVHILKKDASEGTIKLEFTKPENEPFYKATLKQNQTLKIGRSEKSHIKLIQQSISSKHTEIKYENQQFRIHDCLSSTGTWLRLSKKGVKSEMFPLEQGDIIRISSKKTYLIEKMTSSLEQDDELDELEAYFENPNFKVIRQNSEQNFQKILQSTWKRKSPYETKNEGQVYEKLTKI